MEKRCLESPNGPPAQGTYSPAVAVAGSEGNLVFISGQGPFALDGSGAIKGTFEDEARLTLTNLKTVLEDVGSSLDKVVKVEVFLKDMEDFPKLNEICKDFFSSDYPARTCVEAARLPLDIQVEIAAIAVL